MVESIGGNLTHRSSNILAGNKERNGGVGSGGFTDGEAQASTSSGVKTAQRQHENSNLSSNSSSRPLSQERAIRNVIVLLFKLILFPIHKLLQVLFPSGDFDGLSAPVTAKAAQSFVDYLKKISKIEQQSVTAEVTSFANNTSENIDSTNLDHWTTTGFEEIQSQLCFSQDNNAAANSSHFFPPKLLFIYLHSPYHASSEFFCKDVLCKNLLPFLKQSNVVCLGISIYTAQGAYLAQTLQATSYPFVCLLQPKKTSNTTSSSSNRANTSSRSGSSNANNLPTFQLLFKAEGLSLLSLPSSALLSFLNITLTKFEVLAAEQEAKRVARIQETELRRQQDEEYQQTLLIDQQREEEKKENHRKEQELIRIKEEEINTEKQKLVDAKNLIKPEPSSAVPKNTTTRIRFCLPTGSKIDRKFHNDESIQTLKAYLLVHFHEKLSMKVYNIGLSTNFPKKSYNEDDQLTIGDSGLSPQAVIMVQDLDA